VTSIISAFMPGIMKIGHTVEKLEGDTYTDGIVVV